MATFESVNPARPADVVGTFASATADDVDRAVAAATEAQREWAKRPVPARADLIARAADVIAARKGELAALVAREAGKVLVEAGGDVQEAVDMGRFVAGQGRAAMGEVVASELANKMAWTTRQPVGVVGMITPWNFPVAIPSWKCFPALLAGNGIVLKPSEHTPACADAFVDALVTAGIPKALVQVVHGAGEPGAALAVHPGIGALSFTGSVPTGRLVAARAMETGPRLVSLELGGKNAMVVLEDADIDLVIEGALFGAFGTSGQRCTSTSRLVVHRDLATAAVEGIAKRADALVLGDPLVPATDVGPVIDRRSAERILGMIEKAVSEGATLVTGGNLVEVEGCEGGAFISPTVLTGVRPDHTIARQEVFGPVLSVIEVGDEGEAVDVVNASEYGLSAAVYTRDINTALQLVDRIDTGIVYVNAPTIGAEIPLPFGGTKHTGNGFREAGTRGIEQFSQVKTVYVDYSGRLQKAQIDTHPEMGELVMTTLDGLATQAWLDRDETVLASVLSRVTGIVAVEGEGSWLIDADGRRWLDFASGIGVTNIGHCHPRVVAAAEKQLRSLMHTSVVTHHPRSIELAERLRTLVPWMPDAQVFFCNTGAEAVDGAIKLARRVTGRPNVVAFRHGFHGRTLGATSITTAKGKYRAGYEPLLGGVTIAPYAEPDFAELDAILATQTPAHTVAAMIVEPVLGEGGYVVPPIEWLRGLRQRCDEHGVLLVFDEVQTGIGRTGRLFAAETFGVHPDVLLFAKAIASGLPLAGIIAPREVFDRWPTGTHGTTFGGNPVSCAAALATLDVIEEEDLCARARRLGEAARTRLGEVVDVRGVGLMIGVELDSAETAAAVQRACLDAGLIVLTCGPEENVLRLIPALNIPEPDLDLGLEILVTALRSVGSRTGQDRGMSFDPYLMFDSKCKDAFTRYHEIFGGDLTLLRMGDMPDAQAPPEQADLIIHAALNVGGRLLMGSDDPTGGYQGVEGIHVYHEAPDIPTADKVYDALSEGGEATQPMMETFFSPKWGMCKDRFGVRWMVGVRQAS